MNMSTEAYQLTLSPIFDPDVKELLSEPASDHEQLALFDASKPHRIWKIPVSHFIPASRIKEYSRFQTGNTGLGTRIVNSLDAAHGYNHFSNPSPREYAIKNIFTILDDAVSRPDEKPYWNLGPATKRLFQKFCSDIKIELDIK